MGKDYSDSGEEESETERTVFVNGLCYESTEKDIEEFFKECGEIERINLPKYQDSDRNIGYCHVRFETNSGRRNALKLNGKYLNNRYLKIERAKGFKEISIFFGNLIRKKERSRVSDI